MNPTVLFLVGPPGVGKTTLVRHILDLRDPVGARFLVAKPKATVVGSETPGLVLAGHYTGGTFDGADTVPYNGVEPWLEHWKTSWSSAPLTILDGDRFSHQKAVAAFIGAGAKVRVAHIAAEQAELDARRAARGSNQNASWLKGRVTKAERFAQEHSAVRLDGRRIPADLANILLGALGL